MTAHLMILSSALTLGGMASVGFSHYREVEQTVANHHESVEQEAENSQVVTQLEEQLTMSLSQLEENLETKRLREMQEMDLRLGSMMNKLSQVEARQGSHEVLMGQFDKNQTMMEFKIETHGKSFRPLRAINARFQPVRSAEMAHPLLPDLDPSWEDGY